MWNEQPKGKGFCNCCNHRFIASTTQNVVDHMRTNVRDHAVANSAHATKYRLALGFPDRQIEREAMQAKRTARKDGGEKRMHAEINRGHLESQKKRPVLMSRQAHFRTCFLPQWQKFFTENTQNGFLHPTFLEEVMQCGLPVHATEHLLPCLRRHRIA